MKLPVTRSQIQTRFFDTDAVGHISSSAYFHYMEIGRTDFFLEIGKHEPIPPSVVVNIQIDYLRESMFGDAISVVTWCSRKGNKSMVISNDIYAGEVLSARCTATVAGFDMETRKSVPLPGHWQASDYRSGPEE